MNKLTELKVKLVPDENPDTSYLEQEGLGFEDRLESLKRGEFGYVGVQAEAEIGISTKQMPTGHSIIQRIHSHGLWGIEDDSDSSYFLETAEEELDTLKDMLETLNVDLSNWDTLKQEALDNIGY